ncbi:MAG: queuosine precursor transporter [Chlamydiota bacterium]
MNELIFFAHIAILIGFILTTLRLGKEALIAALAVQVILGNLFVTKQTELFGLDVTCSEVYTIGAIFSLNLLQTYFGKKAANKALLTIFFLLFLVIVMSRFHLRYIPSKYDLMHNAFAAVLDHTPRIMTTSFFSALAMQKLDLELFDRLKQRFAKLFFFIPFVCASLITQLLDTVIFSLIALYGIVHNLKEIILMSYLVKIAVIFSIAPFTILVKRLIGHESVQV